MTKWNSSRILRPLTAMEVEDITFELKFHDLEIQNYKNELFWTFERVVVLLERWPCKPEEPIEKSGEVCFDCTAHNIDDRRLGVEFITTRLNLFTHITKKFMYCHSCNKPLFRIFTL